MLKYRIKYTWPDGKVRYRTVAGLCKSPDDAAVFTLVEASDIVKKSRDARIVWDIKTTKEECHDSPVLPLLYDPDQIEGESAPAKHRRRKKRNKRPKRP